MILQTLMIEFACGPEIEIYCSLSQCNFCSSYNQCQILYYKGKQSHVSIKDSLAQDCSDGWSVGSARFV